MARSGRSTSSRDSRSSGQPRSWSARVRYPSVRVGDPDIPPTLPAPGARRTPYAPDHAGTSDEPGRGPPRRRHRRRPGPRRQRGQLPVRAARLRRRRRDGRAPGRRRRQPDRGRGVRAARRRGLRPAPRRRGHRRARCRAASGGSRSTPPSSAPRAAPTSRRAPPRSSACSSRTTRARSGCWPTSATRGSTAYAARRARPGQRRPQRGPGAAGRRLDHPGRRPPSTPRGTSSPARSAGRSFADADYFLLPLPRGGAAAALQRRRDRDDRRRPDRGDPRPGGRRPGRRRPAGGRGGRGRRARQRHRGRGRRGGIGGVAGRRTTRGTVPASLERQAGSPASDATTCRAARARTAPARWFGIFGDAAPACCCRRARRPGWPRCGSWSTTAPTSTRSSTRSSPAACASCRASCWSASATARPRWCSAAPPARRSVADGETVELEGSSATTWVERSLHGVTRMLVQVADEADGPDHYDRRRTGAARAPRRAAVRPGPARAAASTARPPRGGQRRRRGGRGAGRRRRGRRGRARGRGVLVVEPTSLEEPAGEAGREERGPATDEPARTSSPPRPSTSGAWSRPRPRPRPPRRRGVRRPPPTATAATRAVATLALLHRRDRRGRPADPDRPGARAGPAPDRPGSRAWWPCPARTRRSPRPISRCAPEPAPTTAPRWSRISARPTAPSSSSRGCPRRTCWPA